MRSYHYTLRATMLCVTALHVVGQIDGFVSTLAGSPGIPGYKEGIGRAAKFSYPYGIALFAGGSLALVVDHSNYIIRRVDVASLVVSTLAGAHGVSGYADGVGSFARFGAMTHIAVADASGQSFVCETSSHILRRVTISSGLVSTVAGTVGVSGSVDGVGTYARFNQPFGVACDAAGSILVIGDYGNAVVRLMVVSTKIVSTLAGVAGAPGFADGSATVARFADPTGIAMDPAGTFALIVDTDNFVIRRVSIPTGFVSTVAGRPGVAGYSEGVGTMATFSQPTGVAVDLTGTVALIADRNNNVIRRVIVSTGEVSTLAGNGTSCFADGSPAMSCFNYLHGVAMNATVAVVADSQNLAVRVINLVVPSQSVTMTASQKSTATPSVTGSPSSCRTPSPTGSPSPVGSPSSTRTTSPTGSSSFTQSGSQTYSSTPTRSGTQSESISPSPSPSPSCSATPSLTQTVSLTGSQSHSVSASGSQSLTRSMTTSQSSSQAATPSASSEPFVLMLVYNSTTMRSIEPLVVADSLPIATLELWLNRCPPSNSFVVECSLGDVRSLFLSIAHTAYDSFNAHCDLTPSEPVRLPHTVSVGARFTSPLADDVSLDCRVTSATRGPVGYVEQAVKVLPTLWPLFNDAIVVGSNGMMRSSLIGLTFNASRVMTPDASGSLSSLLLDAARGHFEDKIPQLVTPAFSFAVSLPAGSMIILRSTNYSHFARGSLSAFFSSIRCNVSTVSDDGVWLMLETPSAMALCGSISRDCGYTPFQVYTDARQPLQLGTMLSCPPFCPGVIERSGGPVPIPISGGAFALGVEPVPGSNELPTLFDPSSASTSEGFYFSVACFPPGLFPDPATSPCANASAPVSFSCPYGGGFACVTCPQTAVCPGGYRVWPRAGAWVASEFVATSAVLQCPPPTTRCLGWNASLGASQCGVGYKQGSYLCSACAPGYYLDGTGACNACPVLQSSWQRYAGLVFIIVAIIGLIVIVYAALALLVYAVGGTITGGLFRMSNLAIWALMCAQVVSDAASATSPSLPPLISSLYSAAAVLQMQGVLLPPGCTGAAPFVSENAMMACALCLWAVTVTIYYISTRPVLRLCGQITLMWAMLLYPSTVLTATHLLSCETVTMSALGAAGLDGGPKVDSAGLGRYSVVSVAISAYDPYYVCWQGHINAAGILACIVYPLYVFGLPVVTWVWLWRDPWVRTEAALANTTPTQHGPLASAEQVKIAHPRDARPTRTGSQAGAATIVAARSVTADPLLGVFFYDYKPTAWYTKHLDLSLLLLLSLFRALLPRPATAAGIVSKATVICAVLLASCVHVLLARPYLEADAWMGWVRALLLMDSVGITLINAVAAMADIGLGAESATASMKAGSLVLFSMCVLTVAVLIVGFSWHAYQGAGLEQRAIDAAARVAAEMSLSKLEAIGHITVNPMRDTVAQPPPPPAVVKDMPGTVNSDSPAVDDAALRLRGQFMPAVPPLVSTVIDERRHLDATLEVSSSTSSVQSPESTLNPLRVRSSRINSNSHRAGPTVRALSNIAREYTAAVTSRTKSQRP